MSMHTTIQTKLTTAFNPEHIEVVDETSQHNVPAGAESHFKVLVVSQYFEGMPLIKQHRAVNAALQAELRDHLHALAIHTMTPAEWFAKAGRMPPSPPCMGGDK